LGAKSFTSVVSIYIMKRNEARERLFPA